jgi:hypothetical protein
MERWNAAAGGLGLRQSPAALIDAGGLESGTGVPQSKAAAPRAADGASAFRDRTFHTRGIIVFLSEDWF